MTIYQYIKLSESKKENVLKNDALYLEFYSSEDTYVYVYFLNGFFVEVTMKDGKIIDNIPYKRGYKFNVSHTHSIEKRNTFFELGERINKFIDNTSIVSLALTKSVKSRMIRMLLLES